MKLFNSKTHAILDYAVGILLIIAPYLLGFADGTAAQYVPVAVGIVTIMMSLLTKYEYSIFKVIDLKTHLGIDFFLGLFLAASPWILKFNETVYLPHLIVGIVYMLVALLTERVSMIKTNQAAHHIKPL